MIAGDEGCARLEPVDHALFNELGECAINGWRMRDAGRPHLVEDRVGAHGLLGLAQAGQDLGLIARKLRSVMVMGHVHE